MLYCILYVCVCVCVCVCIAYTHTHTSTCRAPRCVYICIYMYIYICIYICMCVCMCVCVCVYVYVLYIAHTHTHTHTHTLQPAGRRSQTFPKVIVTLALLRHSLGFSLGFRLGPRDFFGTRESLIQSLLQEFHLVPGNGLLRTHWEHTINGTRELSFLVPGNLYYSLYYMNLITLSDHTHM
jgi:hypothetical protein